MHDGLNKDDIRKQEELEEQLVRKNYGLVVSQALLFFKGASFTLEDCIQVGLIGLLKAIRKYDKNKAKFSTFASICIRNEITSFVKKARKKNKTKTSLKHLKINWENENNIKKIYQKKFIRVLQFYVKKGLKKKNPSFMRL